MSPKIKPPTSIVRRRRTVGVAAVAFAGLAGTAVAGVAGWTPDLKRTGVDEPQAAIDRVSTVPSAVSERFAVLRAPQTGADRADADPRLQFLGGSRQVRAVQVDGVRSVSASYSLTPVQLDDDGSVKLGVCLTDGESLSCGAADSLPSQGLLAAVARRGTGASIFGLVPDGVKAVRYVDAQTKPVEASVSKNFFELTTAPAAAKADGPPQPPTGRIEWLDGAGTVIGPKR